MACKDEKGDLVLFDDARAEIDSRDKRLIALSTENRELQTKVAAQGKRIAELEAKTAAQLGRIAELLSKLHEAVGKYDEATHSEYEGTSMLAAQLAEVDHLRETLP